MQNLLVKYRPCTLDEVLGQPAVVRALKLFVKKPYPAAFLFHGESGTGKSCAALALAHDLGCAVEEEEIGGVFEIPSGTQTAESVKDMMAHLRFRPLMGSGWKVLIVNECDRMSPQAETVWLDKLEHVPASTVIVFTTNSPERLTDRFRGRCDCYGFTSSSVDLAVPIRSLCKRIWKGEGLRGAIPSIDTLGMPTLEGADAMHCSFRLAVQQLQRIIREAREGDQKSLKRAVEQVLADGAVSGDVIYIECDHCKVEIETPAGAHKVRCRACGKTSAVEYGGGA